MATVANDARNPNQQKADAPHPDDARKPDSPTDLTSRSWKFVGKKTLREFLDDQCTDLAAALTYYAVLALFPALLALLSLLGVFGQGQKTADAVLEMIQGVLPVDALRTLEPVIVQLTESSATGFALVFGLLGALWAASGYVGAFGRAMNRIYEVDEGRPFYKLRPRMIVITAIVLVMVAVAAVLLVVSGPVAEAIGDAIGLGETALTVWNIAKWPVLLGVVVLIVAILYYATPNVQQPRFRWISIGALFAIVVWILASVVFGFYVSMFGNYEKTYGTLAGVIIFLLWLWITNLALLFGAELDAEVERARELQAGLRAEETLQLPPQDTKKSDKDAAKEAKDVQEARDIREDHASDSDASDSADDDGGRGGGSTSTTTTT